VALFDSGGLTGADLGQPLKINVIQLQFVVQLGPAVDLIKALVYKFRVDQLAAALLEVHGVAGEVFGTFVDLFGLSRDTCDEALEPRKVLLVAPRLPFFVKLVLLDELVRVDLGGG